MRGPAKPLQAAIEQRRASLDRQQSSEGRVHRVVGEVALSGAGEGLVDVLFPVGFQERPSMSFGGELGENEPLEDGNFPTINVMVKSWLLKERAGLTYYVGATLVVVTTGKATQQVRAHWQAEGRALLNPLTFTGSTEDRI